MRAITGAVCRHYYRAYTAACSVNRGLLKSLLSAHSTPQRLSSAYSSQLSIDKMVSLFSPAVLRRRGHSPSVTLFRAVIAFLRLWRSWLYLSGVVAFGLSATSLTTICSLFALVLFLVLFLLLSDNRPRSRYHSPSDANVNHAVWRRPT